MKKIIVSVLVVAAAMGSVLTPASTASAQDYGRYERYDRDRRGPPPPERRRHHNNNGKIIAGGLAAGVIGGLIGGALANGGPRYDEPRYVEPPRPRCWFEDQRVRNMYDGGSHIESVRVCN